MIKKIMEDLKSFDVLYFSTTVCGPCKVSKPLVEKASDENGINTKFITVDKDENGRTLAGEYGVRSVPTLIFLKEGEEVGRRVGSLNEKQFVDLWESFK